MRIAKRKHFKGHQESAYGGLLSAMSWLLMAKSKPSIKGSSGTKMTGGENIARKTHNTQYTQ